MGDADNRRPGLRSHFEVNFVPDHVAALHSCNLEAKSSSAPMILPTILAHRGNLDGPDHRRENTVESYHEALRSGFGLEIDVRREAGGVFYISHDPTANRSDLALKHFEPQFRTYRNSMIAINVKELCYEAELAQLIVDGAFGDQPFLIDCELLEPDTPGRTQRMIRSTPGFSGVRLASRLSDRNEPLQQALAISAEIVWADEFDGFWLTAEHVRAVQRAGRRFHVISPELHGFSEDQRLCRWADFKKWGVDAVCTDFAAEARKYFHG